MGRTRVNWHLDTLDIPAGDPFRNIEDLGEQLDLTGDLDRLHALLRTTLDRESVLESEKVTCQIKDNTSSCCHACPERHLDHSDSMFALCQLGIEQERLATQIAVASVAVKQ